MHRRIAPLFLAVLIALPVVVPASAAEPILPPPVDPGAEPTPTSDPTPATEPTPAAVPDPAPAEEPPVVEPAAPPASEAPATPEIPDTTGRYIVMFRNGTDTTAAIDKVRKRQGVTADRSFTRAFRGFAAKLDTTQRRELLADPNVLAVVPDEVVQLTQTVPTGVARVGGAQSDIAAIDGTDQRVDADVAIVDTGISAHGDLNIGGGYNCSTADRTLWRDKNNHGTHVAGTVGALDNSFGVVGVAPGARVWGVKILNDDGYGLISWYICGLDWILAQRDPDDPTRPLFEAVNMSVTKAGSDDGNCGFTNNDPLHQAICRLVAGGVTVVAAAANDSHNAAKNIPASYNEVITVSALADTDGKPGGLGGNRCFSWGGYDSDDTFANFSNYGGDVDLIAPGKCIMSTVPGPGYQYMSGTSMAAPTVAGAVALYKESRPNATPAEVREALRYLGNLNWKTSTDPDSTHEPLLDVSRIGELGTFGFAPSGGVQTVEGGTTASVDVNITRSSTFFERVYLSITDLPDGWTPGSATSLLGWSANNGQVTVAIPEGTPLGRYQIEVTATNQGRSETTTIPVDVVVDDPTANTPITSLLFGVWMGRTSVAMRVGWSPATDPSSSIAGYEVQVSRSGGPWTDTVAAAGNQTNTSYTLTLDGSYRFRIRAQDAAGHWSPWATTPKATTIHAVDDRSSSVVKRVSWVKRGISTAWRSTVIGGSSASASVSMSFTGRGVALVSPKNARLGQAKVYIDGKYIKTISLKSSVGLSRQVVFTSYFAAGGTHTITLRPLGSGKYRLFQVDALLVLK